MNSIDPRLRRVLETLVLRHRRLVLWSKLAACWAGAAFLGLALIGFQHGIGWSSSLALPLGAALGLVAALVIAIRHWRTTPDFHALAQEIEKRHPDLDGRLVTAVQQQAREQQTLNYLQDRVVQEALGHDQQHNWAAAISASRINTARVAHWLSVVLFAV